MITGISTRFIRFRRHEIEPLIVQALAELAEFIEADRAYCLIQANRSYRYEWCRSGQSFPEGWPERAVSLMRKIGTNDRGVLQVRNTGATAGPEIREILAAVGVTEWLCISATSTVRMAGLLAFDRVQAHSAIRTDELSLFRMALDVISNAIERQNLEGDRERLETNLQHARRMETIGALTSGIAHNFNNIVGAILGFTENAQLQLPDVSHANDSLSEIRRAGGRARDLVEQILAFGRRGTVRRTCISVQEWLDEAVSMLEATLPPHVRLAVEASTPGVTICGEPASLQQVILNICNNAAQAMDSPGFIRIEIETSRAAVGPDPAPAEVSTGPYVIISVIDSGRGMDETTLERAFEPFFTTRSEGNGLGLAMVRQIVSDHGGAVRIRSTPGAGTRVDIRLPRASPDELATLQDPPRARGARGGETVLVVESNRERLLRHEEILAALGFEPVGFTRGADAEAAYLADSTRFDAALYCAHLQDGVTVLAEAARLAEAAPHFPVLLASSSPADFAAPTLVEAGIAEIIRQPLSSVELAGALTRCLAGRAAALRSQPQLLPL
jgi:signal transduction histidine kinase/CheY-like chemotaxis protein